MSTGHNGDPGITRRHALAAGAAAALIWPGEGAAQGTMFRDPLLKLFVIADLMRVGRISLGSYHAFHQRLLGRPHDPEIDGYHALPAALAYFAELALSADDLAAVEELDLDGGNPIFRYVDPDWNGHSVGIDRVRRLDDLAAVPNLRRLSASAFLPVHLDFGALAPLSRLRAVSLSLEDDYSRLETLLSLPELAECSLRGNRIFDDVMQSGHPTRLVMEGLRARSTRLLVQWISAPSPGPPPFR